MNGARKGIRSRFVVSQPFGHRRNKFLNCCRFTELSRIEETHDLLVEYLEGLHIIAETLKPGQISIDDLQAFFEIRRHAPKKHRVGDQKVRDLLVGCALRVFIKDSYGGREVVLSLVKGIDAEAFLARQREIRECLIRALCLAVVICERLRYFDEAITAAALDFLRDFEMQRLAGIGEQTLIE